MPQKNPNAQPKRLLPTILVTGIITATVGAVGGYGVARYHQPSLNDSTGTPSTQSTNTDRSIRSADTRSETASTSSPQDNNQAQNNTLAHTTTTPEQPTSPATSTHDLNTQSASGSFSERLSFMQTLTTSDADTLEALINTVAKEPPNNGDKSQPLTLAMLRLFELDPEHATDVLKALLSNHSTQYGNYILMQAMAHMPLANTEELLFWAESNLTGHKKYEISSVLLGVIATQDPLLAIDLAENSTNERYGIDQTESVLYTWSSSDPQAALDWYLANRDSSVDDHRLQMLFDALARTDQYAAEQYLAQLADDPQAQHLQHSLFAGLAQNDPQAAMEKVLAMNEIDERNMIMFSIIQQWSMADPLDAMDYINYQLSGEEREIAMQQLVQSAPSWSAESLGQNASDAFQTIAGMPAEMHTSLQQVAVGQFFHLDPAGTVAAIDTLPDSTNKAELYAQIAWELPQYDLALAQSLYSSATGETRSMLANGITEELYQINPEAAWQFYHQISDPQTKNMMAYGLISKTAEQDPYAALDTLTQMALDEQTKLSLIESTLMNGFGHNKAEMERWLYSAILDQNTRTTLEAMLQNYPDGSYLGQSAASSLSFPFQEH